MNQKEAYELLSEKLGVAPEVFPYLVEVFLDHTILNPILPETAKSIGKILDLRPKQKILDLACGKAGVTLPFVHIYKTSLLGLDLIPDFIREAWARAEQSGLYHLCRFEVAEAKDFVAKAKSQWEAVFCLGAMSHIWNGLQDGLNAVRPLVAKDGHMVIGEAYLKTKPASDSQESFLLKEEIDELMGQAGRIIQVLDDGPQGWDQYLELQKKNLKRLLENTEGNAVVQDFLKEWEQRGEWESRNLGYGVWIVRVG